MFIDDVLIPVKYLINGDSIAQVPTAAVTWFHVELPEHAVLRAEGLPGESYLETGDRAAFENGGVMARLHPDFRGARREALGCAPLIVHGPRVDAAREALARLASTRAPATRPPNRYSIRNELGRQIDAVADAHQHQEALRNVGNGVAVADLDRHEDRRDDREKQHLQARHVDLVGAVRLDHQVSPERLTLRLHRQHAGPRADPGGVLAATRKSYHSGAVDAGLVTDIFGLGGAGSQSVQASSVLCGRCCTW